MKKIIVAILASLATTLAFAEDITGAGASFPAPLYSKWSAMYYDATGIRVNYQSIGSSGGVRQIKAKTVVFGASDAPLKADQLNEAGLIQFPTVFGGVVPVINLPGVEAGQIKLTGPVLADIFEGKITRWRDERIASLNPDVPLPNIAIAVVHRSDGSGTTSIFAEYLASVSPTWKANVGVGSALSWPTGVGGKGNEGVASFVQRINGTIGYVEYAYALQNNLAHARLQNAAGNFVDPDGESFAAAAIGWTASNGSYAQPINQIGPKAWPITGATFILVHKNPSNPDAVRSALKFFDWAYKNGGATAKELHYIPMPQNIVDDIHRMWSSNNLL